MPLALRSHSNCHICIGLITLVKNLAFGYIIRIRIYYKMVLLLGRPQAPLFRESFFSTAIDWLFNRAPIRPQDTFIQWMTDLFYMTELVYIKIKLPYPFD